MEFQSKVPDSRAFTCYFVRNQTWKTNSNQSSVAKAAALKAGELFRIEWLAGCLIIFSCIATDSAKKILLWLKLGLIITFEGKLGQFLLYNTCKKCQQPYSNLTETLLEL